MNLSTSYVKLPSAEKFSQEIPLGPQASSGFNKGLSPGAEVLSHPILRLSFGCPSFSSPLPEKKAGRIFHPLCECVHT